MEKINEFAVETWAAIVERLTSVTFYQQLGIVAVALFLSFVIALIIKGRLARFHTSDHEEAFQGFKNFLYRVRELIFPLLAIAILGFAVEFSEDLIGRFWLVKAVQGLAVIFLFYVFVSNFVTSKVVVAVVTWVCIPVAILYVVGWLDEVTVYLDGIAIEIGNIKLSAFTLARTLFFGAILFWLGRISSVTGRKVIARNPSLDASTREIIVKLFEIGLYVVIFLLLLQVMGINLTALAVFGGALGVGLGFGLQQIASNFVSGIIILLDRSLKIDDFVELEDGRSGRIRELNMRSATLETYDGKDIVVPNETFITSSFTNWTHNNKKQRYPLHFQVAYKTDLENLFEIVREIVASHPKVLSGPDIPIEERPDAEIESFGDSGINILVEFWMEGIDDGENRVGADLLMMIWTALRENGMEIPFPQREVNILNKDKD